MGWVLLMMIVLFVLLVFEFLILLGSFSLSFVILDLFVWCFGSVFPFFFVLRQSYQIHQSQDSDMC